MRNIVFATLVALMGLFASAQATIDCQPGQLSSLVEDCSITQLQVSGHVDARDFRFIADSLRHLTVLDLSNATIDAFSGKALFANVESYPADEVPCLSLASMLELTNFVLPSNATRLGDGCFSGCTQLKYVELVDNLTHIGDYAFSGCAQLEHLAVPNSLTHIGDGAFSNCQSLVSIELMPILPGKNDTSVMPSTLHIGYRAFANCPNLKYVLPGKPLASLGAESLAATGLEELDLSSQASLTSLPDWVLSESSLTQLTLPSSLQSIGDGALMDDEGITTLTLPANVNYIGSHAMAYMTGLKQLDSEPTEVPALGDSVWYGVEQSKVKLNVNPSSLNDYRAAAQWCNFMTIEIQRGDVNADGTVDIADINILINIMLERDDADNYDGRAELTGDGTIDIADINAVINIMLQKRLAMRQAAMEAARQEAAKAPQQTVAPSKPTHHVIIHP